MKKYLLKTLLSVMLFTWQINAVTAQEVTTDRVIDEIEKEANENSRLERLAHELLDVIGPRLVGTPQMQQAHDWAVGTFEEWDIEARNEQWGEWKGWERGVTHVDLVSPRVVSLEAMQLAWESRYRQRGSNGGNGHHP